MHNIHECHIPQIRKQKYCTQTHAHKVVHENIYYRKKKAQRNSAPLPHCMHHYRMILVHTNSVNRYGRLVSWYHDKLFSGTPNLIHSFIINNCRLVRLPPALQRIGKKKRRKLNANIINMRYIILSVRQTHTQSFHIAYIVALLQ